MPVLAREADVHAALHTRLQAALTLPAVLVVGDVDARQARLHQLALSWGLADA